ncbi:hypothetical protein MXD62_05360 [Frankia sp. Mgl5]|uniref:hypothetical protein n=1 Tax=Frankia sp. Mgl5 TaxID=2933793 RepID=UPI00201075C6|nr:hypothetical protein [Frankia sp. Mgl5]MCK9926602.1 hypothetical protein [Frankia sp. Mgl5]
MAGALSRAENPVVLNFGGAGQTGPVRWDDIQLERGCHGVGAMGHAGRLNDLLGVDFVDTYADTGIRYVLNHPGVVVTSFAGEYDPVTAAQVDRLRVVGKPVATAVLEGRRVSLEPGPWDLGDARRLHDLTRGLLAQFDRRTA